jgi:hypothetical protein
LEPQPDVRDDAQEAEEDSQGGKLLHVFGNLSADRICHGKERRAVKPALELVQKRLGRFGRQIDPQSPFFKSLRASFGGVIIVEAEPDGLVLEGLGPGRTVKSWSSTAEYATGSLNAIVASVPPANRPFSSAPGSELPWAGAAATSDTFEIVTE